MTTTAMLIISEKAMDAASNGINKYHTQEANALQHVQEDKTMQVKLLLNIAKKVGDDDKMHPTQANQPASSNEGSPHLRQEEALYKNMKGEMAQVHARYPKICLDDSIHSVEIAVEYCMEKDTQDRFEQLQIKVLTIQFTNELAAHDLRRYMRGTHHLQQQRILVMKLAKKEWTEEDSIIFHYRETSDKNLPPLKELIPIQPPSNAQYQNMI